MDDTATELRDTGTKVRTTGKETAITLQALELQVEALTELPLNALPQTARTILRSVANLLVAVKWLVEDAMYKPEGP